MKILKNNQGPNGDYWWARCSLPICGEIENLPVLQEDLVVKDARQCLLNCLLDLVPFEVLSEHQKTVLILSLHHTQQEVAAKVENSQTAISHSVSGIIQKSGKIHGGSIRKLRSIMEKDSRVLDILADLKRLDEYTAKEILEKYDY